MIDNVLSKEEVDSIQSECGHFGQGHKEHCPYCQRNRICLVASHEALREQLDRSRAANTALCAKIARLTAPLTEEWIREVEEDMGCIGKIIGNKPQSIACKLIAEIKRLRASIPIAHPVADEAARLQKENERLQKENKRLWSQVDDLTSDRNDPLPDHTQSRCKPI